jgi:hypothetical protein
MRPRFEELMRLHAFCIVVAPMIGSCVADPSSVGEPRTSPPAAAGSASASVTPAHDTGAPPAHSAPTTPPCPGPQRTVDPAQVKVASTMTTGCKRLPTQKALAEVPDFVVETRCAGPDASTTLEVNEEDGRTFFAVSRAGTQRIALDVVTQAFNRPAGAARWYRIDPAPAEAIVIPVRWSSTDDSGKQGFETLVVAWDLRSGRVCRIASATGHPENVAATSDALGRAALAGKCDCPWSIGQATPHGGRE